MHNEQVFTPKHVVDKILIELEYCGDNIRKHHIMDNSCGDGAFLCRVATLYINTCIMDNLSKEETCRELAEYIHGIEIDSELYHKTLENLKNITDSYSLEEVKWDIVNADAMDVNCYDNKMDYVVGNPPYCNVHDLGDRYDKVTSYKFAQGGMTDLYLVFFEIGINMLNENGKLGYITPNSWLTSLAGANFRKYLLESKTLIEIHQYGHTKIFDNATTYTCLTFLSKKPKDTNYFILTFENTTYKVINGTGVRRNILEKLDNCSVGGKFYLCDNPNTLKLIHDVFETSKVFKGVNTRIRVKNGFATLNDKFFMMDDFINENPEYKDNDNVLEVVKASNGETHWFFYPYDKEGKAIKDIEKEGIDKKLLDYIYEKCDKHDVSRSETGWWLYGRTQAINDVKYDKIVVNNLIRDVEDLKIRVLENEGNKQYGVYSGYYIPIGEEFFKKPITKEIIIDAIKNDDFVRYIKAVGNYKNGGYYTFSSKDLENWLNFYCFKPKFL